MADNDTPAESDKKGIGAVGGVAALGVGAATSVVAANALHDTAVKSNREAYKAAEQHLETISDQAAFHEINFKQYAEALKHSDIEDPKILKLNKKVLSSMRENTKRQYAALVEGAEGAVEKLFQGHLKFEEAKDTNFLKKGLLVFKGGDANIKTTVIIAGLSAAMLTAIVANKITGHSHTGRIEQERTAAAQSPSQGPAA